VYWLADPWLTLELALETRAWYYRWPRRLYDAGLRLLGIPSGKVRRDHLIFVSRALQAEYVRLGARVGQGTVIYPGIPAELAQFQPQHILSRDPSEPPRILYFGAISAFKGVMTLVEALGRLRRLPDLAATRLTLLGNVHQEEFGVALRIRIRDLGLQDAVELVPRCPRSELPAVFRRHDVQAFTSEGVEAYSLSLLEGMAAGLPVVSSLCGGSAEILRDGVNGRTFRAGDAGDLAAKLAWLLQHPEEAARMGRAASAEVQQRGTLRSQVDALEAYLQNVGPGRPAPARAGQVEDGAPRERAGTFAG
jgi:glycosyltransferase involved in cell wall biosynthesis